MTSLRATRQMGGETRASRFATRALLTAQVALACSLLVGSLLLVRSFANLVNADRGMAGEGVVRVRVTGFEDAFVSADPLTTYRALDLAYASLQERFAAWPAISAVALSRELPPQPGRDSLVHSGPPGDLADPGAAIRSDDYRVGPSFFAVYGISIIRGRAFAPGDSDWDVVIGERLAGLLWPDQDPLGRTFAVDGFTSPHRVVGVAREIRLPTLDPALDRPELYRPLGAERTVSLNFRCRQLCPGEAEVRAQVQAVHPALQTRAAPSSEEVVISQRRLPRATAEVGGLFAVVAILTAAGGLFSVLSYAVGRRRREFGIRTALGAAPGQIRRLVWRDGLSIVAIGVAAGAAGGWAVARALAAFHYGVTAADPATWAAVLGTVGLTSLAATWRPAQQAMRVDPVTLLREE